jgi:hypothetical protein
MSALTPAALDELAKLEAAATPGAWDIEHDHALLIALRNAAPELIRLARIGLAYEGSTTDLTLGITEIKT